jgi:type I restriction enzyme, S subunit
MNNTNTKQKISDISQYISGVTFKETEATSLYQTGYLPILRSGNIRDGELNTNDDFVWVPSSKVSQDQYLQVGDIVMCMSSGSSRVVGKTAYVDKLFHGSIGAFCGIFRPRNEIQRKYLAYWFKSEEFLKWRDSQAKGINIQNLRPSQIMQIEITLPPLPKQKHIAGILGKADRLRQLRRFAREMSDTYLQSVFMEMFGDPAKNPMRWQQPFLVTLCNPTNGIKAGPFGSSIKKEIYTNRGIRVYGQEQVISGDFTLGDYFISDSLFDDFKAYIVKPGDVLISLVGTLGKVVVVPDKIKPGIINPRLIKISPTERQLDPFFLKYFLENRSTQLNLLRMSHGGTMDILNSALLKELKIIAPPFPLQEQFARIVYNFERLHTQQREAERQAEHLFQTLLHKAFGGE